MADELSAFFSDIAAVEGDAPADSTQQESQPPAKKVKVAKAVVASKPAVISAAPVRTLTASRPSSSLYPSSSSSGGIYGPASEPTPIQQLNQQVNTQYRAVHVGMTDEEAKHMEMQQSGYDYQKQARLAVFGEGKEQRALRMSAGKVWVDKSLEEWPEDDYRLFAGDVGNEVTDDLLCKAFAKYSSFARAKVVRDKYTGKSKGFGFISFLDPFDCARALREMNGKYVGNRPLRLKKSDWKDRDIKQVRKKDKTEKKRKAALGLS